MVVAADVYWFALGGVEFVDDLGFVGGEFGCQVCELGLEFFVFRLAGEGLGPVECQIEVAASVVEFVDFARRRLVVFQVFTVCRFEGFCQDE